MRAAVAALLASAALVAGHLALGGGDFEPAAGRAPCSAQVEGANDGLGGTVERVGLSALGGAACELGVSRERLLLGLAGEVDLGVDDARRTAAFRSGLDRAIEAEERAGRLGGTEAFVLRQGIRLLPVDALLERLFGGSG